MSQTGARSRLPEAIKSTTSPDVSPCRCARAGLMSAALSQVSWLNGRGHSCNQPLLANCPSQTLGSDLKQTSRPVSAGLDSADKFDFAAELKAGSEFAMLRILSRPWTRTCLGG